MEYALGTTTDPKTGKVTVDESLGAICFDWRFQYPNND